MKLSILALCTAAALMHLNHGFAQAVPGNPSPTLRLPAALAHASAYGDVAAEGNTSAASISPSSSNPAALAWAASSPFALDGGYSYSWFQNGSLGLLSQSALIRLGNSDAIRVSMGGADFDGFVGDSTQLGWFSSNYKLEDADSERYFRLDFSHSFSPQVSFGGAFQIGRSTIRESTNLKAAAPAETITDGVLMIMMPAWSYASSSLEQTRGTIYTWSAGLTVRPFSRVTAGFLADYSLVDARTSFSSDINESFFGLDSFEESHRSETQRFLFQPGISYEYLPDAHIEADYQFDWIEDPSPDLANQSTGHDPITTQEICLGADYPLFSWAILRAGSAIDFYGNVGWTAGVSFTIPHYEQATIDLAYQHDIFPETVQPNAPFGRSNTFVASARVLF